MNIIAIDPGHVETAVVQWNGAVIHRAMFLSHAGVREFLRQEGKTSTLVAIETVSSYGMPVGKEVFETVRETGRYIQICADNDIVTITPTRQQVVVHLCRRMGGDAQVRAAIIERYGQPGTKKEPGVTYGLKRDLWQAFGVAVYAADLLSANALKLEVPTP